MVFITSLKNISAQSTCKRHIVDALKCLRPLIFSGKCITVTVKVVGTHFARMSDEPLTTTATMVESTLIAAHHKTREIRGQINSLVHPSTSAMNVCRNVRTNGMAVQRTAYQQASHFIECCSAAHDDNTIATIFPYEVRGTWPVCFEFNRESAILTEMAPSKMSTLPHPQNTHSHRTTRSNRTTTNQTTPLW